MRDLLHGYLQWKSNMKHFKDNVASKAPTSLASSMASSGNAIKTVGSIVAHIWEVLTLAHLAIKIGNPMAGVRRGQPANKRRRVRGGATSLAPVAKHSAASFQKEAEVIATL
jgi:DNA excision repair protein ERCC-4